MTQFLPQMEIALDIGHSSIGWAVFQNDTSFDLLGTGVVLFPADDCLAIKRRNYRRQRRHVRATRQRIERLKKLLLYLDVLTEAELNEHPGKCAWPWKLAAEVLIKNGRTLTWPELWDVLRWYAHNRGYDGNARWNRQEIDPEDSKKEQEAKRLMEQYGTTTLAETFCAILEVKPDGTKRSSRVRFKGLNAAFPRETVQGEVRRILEAHVDKLPQITEELVRAVVGDDNPAARQWDDDAWKKAVVVPDVHLPKRYRGSYLFGQSVPRFENRIISSCPITYQRILAETGDRKRALRDSKVPAKKCREFLFFRWAMILANLTVNDGRGTRRLTSEERKAIHEVMVKGDPEIKCVPGHLTPKQLKNAVIQKTGALLNNVDAYFLTPRADEALWLRPGKLPSGRAPYTRQVMREAVKDVFAGKHPTEEGGCLYRGEAVREAQLQRSLEEKTNNHLVRHRVLIARRLVADVIKSYAAGEKSRIGRVTIEVNRDLQAFSGMTNKEIEGELTQMLKDHSGVVKKLEKDFAEVGKKYRITPGLIRKARIAHDLGWKCPYTGKDYGSLELASGTYDKDHIIPRSLRPSDSLESLVITSKAINAMKGNRTALQFIKECAGQDIEGVPGVGNQRPNLFTEASYRQFLAGLDLRNGHQQDRQRKSNRKKLLELEHYEEKGFLPKDLTQTSHLVRLAAAEMEKEFEGVERKPRIVSLPGSVTGEIRKGWKLYGCLAAHNPEVEKLLEREKTEEINVKKELRDITHLHHALDACVIGYASHFLPNDGGLWETLVKRNRKPDENAMLLARGIFSQDSEGRARLSPLRDELKQQITERLGECRVVQHIPKRMDGLVGLEENTRGIVAIEIPDIDAKSGKTSKTTKLKEIWNNKSKQPLPALGDLSGAVVHLQQYGPRDPKNQDKRERKMTQEKAAKLIGLRPEHGDGKLRAIKGVRVVGANFGLALWRKGGNPDDEPETRIILWHKVWPQLNEIAKKENGGKWPQVFRNGQLIKVTKGRYQGVWQISSIKNNQKGLALDIVRPEMVKLLNGVDWAKINVTLKTLIADGMSPIIHGLTGVSLKE